MRINKYWEPKRIYERKSKYNYTYAGKPTKRRIKRSLKQAKVVAKAMLIAMLFTIAYSVATATNFYTINGNFVEEKSEARLLVEPHSEGEDTLQSSPTDVVTKEDVKAEIIRQAQIHGVDAYTALRIADCESNFNPNAKNPNSTASGVYQFINKTFKNYCKGDVFNYQDNIKCFFELYPLHPSWWECSKLI